MPNNQSINPVVTEYSLCELEGAGELRVYLVDRVQEQEKHRARLLLPASRCAVPRPERVSACIFKTVVFVIHLVNMLLFFTLVYFE